MAVTKEQVIDFLSTMTVMDMANLVKELEEKWGVEAAPAVVAGMGGGAAPAAAVEEKEEQTEFDVVITEVGEKKIEVIKVIRALTSVGLKEAKDLAANGQVVKAGVSKEDAKTSAEQLTAAGATVEVK
ncbi:50S ribosomal protein L7/L12 [Myxococcota bacterium]|nr:50S ribosomal protein L7/L12 [Myxococcota bacterium]MBU1537158.1 50S ribosomal protein L7/L12 [Myxococcota bacterium]